MSSFTDIHPFETRTGSLRLASPVLLCCLLFLSVAGAFAAARLGVIGSAMIIPLLAVGLFGYCLFRFPVVGLYTAVVMGFVLIGLGRYLKGVQIGLGMDAILLLSYVALFISRFRKNASWSIANRDITWLAIIWFLYALFQIVNPEARSFEAWFSGRGISVYMLLLVPLALVFIRNQQRLDTLMYIWGVCALLATVKGILQMQLGVDYAEQDWLNEGNYKTHVLFGKLRVFSFLSDAGQFGANQAYTSVVFTIYAMAVTGFRKKLFFRIVAIAGIYGMFISGTRGAMSVVLAGFLVFFILRKNIRVLLFGLSLIVAAFVFFKYTSIGQGNDQIRRMRTAFDPNDASLQVRLDNQRILKSYLASRPFGGGIGHGGVKAKKYLPNAFLSQIATDSWYVLIWVEQGIVGLVLHLFILLYVLVKSGYRIMFRIRDPQLKLKMAALASGMAGIMAASYGNAVLGTMPTGTLIYISMAILMNSRMQENKSSLLTH